MSEDRLPPVETIEEFLERNKPPATTPEQYRQTAELMRPTATREQAS